MICTFDQKKTFLGALTASLLLFLAIPVGALAQSIESWGWYDIQEIVADPCSLSYITNQSLCNSTYLPAYGSTTLALKLVGPYVNLQKMTLDSTPDEGDKFWFFNPQILAGTCNQDANGIQIESGKECWISWGGLWNADNYGIANGASATAWPWNTRGTMEGAFPSDIDFDIHPYIYYWYNGTAWDNVSPSPTGPFPYEFINLTPVFNIYPTEPETATTTYNVGGES